ncbi:unnamed protein product, partial [Oppiella nova]
PFNTANREWKYENCSLINGDECAQRLYIFGYRAIDDKSTALNIPEMKEYCQETREAEKCVKQWSQKCLKPFERQCLNLLLSGATQSRKSLCTFKGQQRFLQNRQCFIKTVNTQHDCMDQFKEDMNKILAIDKSDLKLKLRFADKWLQCFRESAKKVCDANGMKFLKWVVDPYVADALDMGCSKDWTYGTDICTTSLSRVPIQPNSGQNTSHSILFPLYMFLSDFGKLENTDDFESFRFSAHEWSTD